MNEDEAISTAASRLLAQFQRGREATRMNPREYLQITGGMWWSRIFRGHDTDDMLGAMQRAWDYLRDLTDRDLAAVTWACLCEESMQYRIFQAARWHAFGRPVVRVGGHKLCAALMSTAASNDVDFRLPWRATLIELPPGLLSTDVNGIDEPICHVLASVFPNIEGKDHWAYRTVPHRSASISYLHP